MQEEITPELFQHLVELAAFELSPQEGDYLRRELNKQLRAIRELEGIEVGEQVPITSHGVPYPVEISPQPRADEAVPFPSPEKILAQAPESEDGYYVVPDIPHTDLS